MTPKPGTAEFFHVMDRLLNRIYDVLIGRRFVNDRGEIICKVQKGLYRLREAPLLWSIALVQTLEGLRTSFAN